MKGDHAANATPASIGGLDAAQYRSVLAMTAIVVGRALLSLGEHPSDRPLEFVEGVGLAKHFPAARAVEQLARIA